MTKIDIGWAAIYHLPKIRGVGVFIERTSLGGAATREAVTYSECARKRTVPQDGFVKMAYFLPHSELNFIDSKKPFRLYFVAD